MRSSSDCSTLATSNAFPPTPTRLLLCWQLQNRHLTSAESTADTDPEGAFTLAYDAARKTDTALLAHQGLRPTSSGGHIVIVDAMSAQFPGVGGLKSIDRLRRRRNQAEYPDPQNYDPVTTEEVHDAIAAARASLDAAGKLIGVPQFGIF